MGRLWSDLGPIKTKRKEKEITTRSALFLNCSQENFLGWQFCQVFKFSGHLPELDIGNLEEMLIWQPARGHKVLIDSFWSSSEVQESDLLLTELGLTYMWTRYIWMSKCLIISQSYRLCCKVLPWVCCRHIWASLVSSTNRRIREELRAHFIGRGSSHTIGAQYLSYVSTSSPTKDPMFVQ